jgi:Ner family transcriptional regulator
MARKPKDKSPEEILYLLSVEGRTCADVDRTFKLPTGTASKTLGYPYEKGERAIAFVLGLKAHAIWPSRYTEKGQRLKPQPSKNYKPRRRIRHCQKRKSA